MEVLLHLPLLPDVELVAAKAVDVAARAMGMSQVDIEAASVATIEACLNAMEHGGRDALVVRLRADEDGRGERLVVEVEDHGGGFDPAVISPANPARMLGCAAKRGWGLTLIRELMDEVQISSVPGTTVVTMAKYVESEG